MFTKPSSCPGPPSRSRGCAQLDRHILGYSVYLTKRGNAAGYVRNCSQHRLGSFAVATVDELELDATCQVGVALDDLNVGHGGSPCEMKPAGPRMWCPSN